MHCTPYIVYFLSIDMTVMTSYQLSKKGLTCSISLPCTDKI